jgi:RNA recognition motif-containing protein
MSNRVYVGNLAWSVSWQDLKDHMRDAGDVQYSKILTDREGRSKGCGIVEFSTAEGAADAIEKLTDTELKGRKIFVREDREDGKRGGGGGDRPPREPRASKGGDSKGGDAAAPAAAAAEKKEKKAATPAASPAATAADASNNNGDKKGEVGTQLFVGNLSWDTTWQELKDHFASCGTVEHSNVAVGRDGRKKGFGFIQFATAKEATEATEKLNGVEFMGRKLEVRLDNKA